MTDLHIHPEYMTHLTGILKTPDDDLRRLVLADWLEEHGENERAEFIRVQCRLAELGECRGYKSKPWPHPGGRCCLSGCEFCWLTDRERELWGTPGFADKFSSLTTCVLPDHKKTQFRLWTEYGPLLTVRRGFVASVRCRLVDWFGVCEKRCGRCSYVAEHPWEDRCPSCHSHHPLSFGFYSGIGPRLVREHPVERVVLTDQEPWTDGTETDAPTGYDFAWWRKSAWDGRGDERNARGNLPDAVFDLLGELYPDNRLIWSGPPSNQHIGFPTRDAALAALSAACIAWAKDQPFSRA